MEKTLGKVISTDGAMAQVAINRGSMCGDSCSNCGMCENKGTKILVKNQVGANRGDTVRLGVSTSKGLGAAMVVYLVPVVILIASLVLFINAGLSEGISALLSFLIMAVWFAGVFVAEKSGLIKEKIYAEIIEIIDKAV